jgi:hypothetical protein
LSRQRKPLNFVGSVSKFIVRSERLDLAGRLTRLEEVSEKLPTANGEPVLSARPSSVPSSSSSSSSSVAVQPTQLSFGVFIDYPSFSLSVATALLLFTPTFLKSLTPLLHLAWVYLFPFSVKVCVTLFFSAFHHLPFS